MSAAEEARRRNPTNPRGADGAVLRPTATGKGKAKQFTIYAWCGGKRQPWICGFDKPTHEEAAREARRIRDASRQLGDKGALVAVYDQNPRDHHDAVCVLRLEV